MSYEIDPSSAWAKLRHAERRRDALNTSIEAFAQDPNTHAQLMANLETDSGFHIVRIKHLPDLGPFTERVSLEVGEVVHNLRGALDHFAWQLACSFANGQPAQPRQVYFPACKADAGKPHLDPTYLDPVVWSQIHEYQPCKGRNGRPDRWSGEYIHQLTLIQRLSNDDKHQRLAYVRLVPSHFSTISRRTSLPPWIVETTEGLSFAPEKLSDPDPDTEEISFEHASKHVEPNAEVLRVRAPAWGTMQEIDNVGEMIPRFALDEDRPVVPTLSRLIDYVRLVLTDLEPH